MMITKEKRIKEVEARIHYLKEELLALNTELAVLKGTDILMTKNNDITITEKNKEICDRTKLEESKCFGLSEKLINAMKIYKEFRKCGLKEKIVYQKVKGNFSTLYRYFDNNRFNHTAKFNIFLYDLNESCKKGKYPKLNCLLEKEKYGIDEVKDAVLEDLNEVMNGIADKTSKVYDNLIKFSEVVKKYKE
ncbi:MAG: hypothetical protein E7313_04780 [Clostridiales bacterium]|nr:hypothetical protein [Clostridiales bacterium]